MKAYFFLMLFCIGTSNFCSGQKFDSSYCNNSIKKLLEVKYSDFNGKKFNKVLINVIFQGYKDYIFLEKKPFVISGVLLNYCDSVFLEVKFKKIKYQKSFSISQDWSFSRLGNEKIMKINVVTKRRN